MEAALALGWSGELCSGAPSAHFPGDASTMEYAQRALARMLMPLLVATAKCCLLALKSTLRVQKKSSSHFSNDESRVAQSAVAMMSSHRETWLAESRKRHVSELVSGRDADL
jgi:hypothetical protein